MSSRGTQDDGWESKADVNWGSAPAAAPEQPSVERVTSAPQANNIAPNEDGGAIEPQPSEPGANPDWVAQGRTQYDYESISNRLGEYDGNARVYHWDGEEGDIGPEFPELEAELFGPPDKRDLPQGLDFSRYAIADLFVWNNC